MVNVALPAGQPVSSGHEGGGPFDYPPIGEALRNQIRMTSIRMADRDGVIRRLEVGYASDKAKWTTIHGGDGNYHEMFYLDEGQFPTRIDVRAGSFVDRIEVFLNDGRSTWAGGGGGSAYRWDTPAGSVVLGFSGRCGEKLDQIKIIHAALKPAEYKVPVL